MIIATDIVPIQLPASVDIAGWLAIAFFLLGGAKLVLWFTDRNKPQPPLHKAFADRTEFDQQKKHCTGRHAELFREIDKARKEASAEIAAIGRELKTEGKDREATILEAVEKVGDKIEKFTDKLGENELETRENTVWIEEQKRRGKSKFMKPKKQSSPRPTPVETFCAKVVDAAGEIGITTDTICKHARSRKMDWLTDEALSATLTNLEQRGWLTSHPLTGMFTLTELGKTIVKNL